MYTVCKIKNSVVCFLMEGNSGVPQPKTLFIKNCSKRFLQNTNESRGVIQIFELPTGTLQFYINSEKHDYSLN